MDGRQEFGTFIRKSQCVNLLKLVNALFIFYALVNLYDV